MTFIEEITPYIQRIKLHEQGGRITDINVLRVIRDIHFKYIRSNDFDIPSNLGCSNCVRHMMVQLIGKIDRDSCIGKKMTFPKVEKIEVTKEYEQLKEIVKADGDTTHLRWGAFKKYCTFKGITVKGKTRVELENELKGL